MHLRLSLAGAVAAVLAAPAAAVADPVLDPLEAPCYVSASMTQRQPVAIHAKDFMPGSVIDVFVDEVFQPPQDPAKPPTADANGELRGSVMAPYVELGQRLFTLRLTEHGGHATASQTAKVTALSISQSPSQPRTTSSRVRFRGRGFTYRTLPIYAHYVLDGKSRRTVLIGKPFGDCGQFSVRRRQFPFKDPHVGTWWVQFDQEQAYNPQPALFTKLKIVVKKVRKRGS